ncbi:NAD(P)-binding domain-containing protein [Gulosibacter molinativorax]|uniref:NAD(P)/FAD-dependent oxidoreductase n=1 Tax=Gulosibacter molinativorax TaxID=256821 RepID=A0ABT7C857_9MICO|nr:NAD(P)-binding domain-containing protein [Gulosibacter molinativorax]MDJ1371379.1 NAD(P)/FAD-dependent oxidoreductase [Gulosibacter molinativorax]QUY62877.1 Putative FAD-dependant oxidoreductase [Gulosibacter molinativorax]
MSDIQRIDTVVIGAGAAGLTAAYSLKALGQEPLKDFAVLDEQPGPGGTWRRAWDFLTIKEALRSGELVDLAGQAEIGLSFNDLEHSLLARDVVPRVWQGYEDAYDLYVAHSLRVVKVESRLRRDEMRVTVEHANGRRTQYETLLVINATGTWSAPFVPWYRGLNRYSGETTHAQVIETLQPFAGKRVLVVGGGRTAVSVLLELERLGAQMFWATRREPDFLEPPRFSLQRGRQLTVGEVGLNSRRRVERLAARGKPMPSDVAVRGLPMTRTIFDAVRRGTLTSRGPIHHFTESGVEFEDGSFEAVDAVVWATGGRESARHLSPLGLRDAGGTPKISGGWSRRDQRVAFLGYGPGVETTDALDQAIEVSEDVIDRLID